MTKPSAAFTELVTDHIAQKVARRLEHFVNNAECLTAVMADVDEEITELRATVRAELLPMYQLFNDYAPKKARIYFALSLQRIESMELNAVETKDAKNARDNEYDGNAVDAELESIYAAYELAPEPRYYTKKFDTIVPSHFDPSKTWIMKNTTEYNVQKYLNTHKLPGKQPIYFEQPTENHPKGRFLSHNSRNVVKVIDRTKRTPTPLFNECDNPTPTDYAPPAEMIWAQVDGKFTRIERPPYKVC